MAQPLTVFPGAEVFGSLNLVAHARQSYDIFATLGVKSMNPQAPDQQVLFADCNRPVKHCCHDIQSDYLNCHVMVVPKHLRQNLRQEVSAICTIIAAGHWEV